MGALPLLQEKPVEVSLYATELRLPGGLLAGTDTAPGFEAPSALPELPPL